VDYRRIEITPLEPEQRSYLRREASQCYRSFSVSPFWGLCSRY
jgi:hypothetical protein